MAADLGERLASVRKRRGLTQRDLAEVSGISVSLIKQLEQGMRSSCRLETLRTLAVALGVHTFALQGSGGSDTEWADPSTAQLWAPVRRALAGAGEQPAEAPTIDGVRGAFAGLRLLAAGHSYRRIAEYLPDLIRDAEVLDDSGGRVIRAQILGLTGSMLIHNRQFDTAAEVLARAIDQAPDRGSAASAVIGLVWSHLRQGQLYNARQLAVRWADDIEPRLSRATSSQLALWGKLWLYVANASVRDAAPGATEDALSLARAAAERIGRETLCDSNPNRTFGPVTCAQVAGECAVIAGHPERTLAIARSLPPGLTAPKAASRLRHRLDVAAAHTALRQYAEAMTVLAEVRDIAPEWLPQQRYARDTLGKIITGRRTLTDDMRELADAIRLEY
ncbi:helix-turn-helix domain-containing protein [Nocardia sp. CNY236]|uniref:helix-turn-helix domain-containing protein n=1 Tax=Nocardia sp. CNY236 TaxID=1169152 RepID=UPI0004909279|nr:helix-turn-helix domain-containing protein [Nocardia sp. CNY236]